MKNKEFIIFDVETTGLSFQNGDRVIEIAALKVKNLEPVDKFCSFVDPERELSYGAFLVNGITPAMLKNAPKGKNVWPRFMEFIDDGYLVGHNVGFDLGFLSNEIFLIGEKIKNQKRAIDTLRMARGLMPSLGSYSLARVAYALGIYQEQHHRAMSDVHLTYEVFCKLLHKAQEKSITRLDTLLTLFGCGKDLDPDEAEEKILLIEKAIEESKLLNLSYFSPSSATTTTRRVIPKKLVRERGMVKLVGFCHLRGEERDFRIDRILSLEKLP